MNTATVSTAIDRVARARRVERLVAGQATSDGAGVRLTRTTRRSSGSRSR